MQFKSDFDVWWIVLTIADDWLISRSIAIFVLHEWRTLWSIRCRHSRKQMWRDTLDYRLMIIENAYHFAKFISIIKVHSFSTKNTIDDRISDFILNKIRNYFSKNIIFFKYSAERSRKSNFNYSVGTFWLELQWSLVMISLLLWKSH